GRVTTDITGPLDNAIDALTQQADGKLLAVGHAADDFAVFRYNLDGTADSSFGMGGMVRTDFTSTYTSFDEAKAVTLQSDGKVVVAGGNVTGDIALARYLADGTL